MMTSPKVSFLFIGALLAATASAFTMPNKPSTSMRPSSSLGMSKDDAGIFTKAVEGVEAGLDQAKEAAASLDDKTKEEQQELEAKASDKAKELDQEAKAKAEELGAKASEKAKDLTAKGKEQLASGQEAAKKYVDTNLSQE